MPPPSRPWALVSPASRGIGRALARHLLQTTRVPVVATARGDVNEARDGILKELGDVVGRGARNNNAEERLKVLKLDVCDEATIASAASDCRTLFPPKSADGNSGGWHLHLAYLVPGLLFPEKSPAHISADDALLTFRTNTLGPLLAIKHFSPLLPRKSTIFREDGREGGDAYTGLRADAAVWATMSARVGSIADNKLGGWYSYRASKAGVNQVVRTFDQHLRATAGDRAMAVGLHPGTVRTELSREFWGGVPEGKLFEAAWVAGRLGEVVAGLGVEGGRGRCWDWKGVEVPP